MRFTKMHGTGNDFVYVDLRNERVENPSELARAMCDRRRGVGSDGLILIAPAENAVARMEMYNVDGSRARMCGNGLRCVAKYVFDHGLTRGTSFPIDTDDGVKLAVCEVAGGRVVRVRLDMGRPRFAPSDIPVSLDGDEVIDRPIDVNGRALSMTCVSMGNPHAVIFVDSLDSIVVDEDGPALERHPLFPRRVNAHFVEVVDNASVKVLTWERGCGPTQACGTGMCAVCAGGVRTGRTRRRVTTFVPGGRLDLEWADDNHVYLTGDAVEVFAGQWDPRA